MKAQLSSFDAESPFVPCDDAGAPADPRVASVRLADVMARVDPTWVEAVAIVQAVCAQLAPGQAPPAVGEITLSSHGTVTFVAGGPCDDDAAVKAVGRLLTTILRQGDCPMPVWEASELARRSPGQFGTAQKFGASLTCFPAHQGPQELASYVASSRRQVLNPARPATAVFGTAITARALLVLLAVSAGGVGAGMSLGAVVARHTASASVRVAEDGLTARQDRAPLLPGR